jgi:hypothetical protein
MIFMLFVEVPDGQLIAAVDSMVQHSKPILVLQQYTVYSTIMSISVSTSRFIDLGCNSIRILLNIYDIIYFS